MSKKILLTILCAIFTGTLLLHAQQVEILNESLLTSESFNRFTVVNRTGFQVWNLSTSYGAMISGFSGGQSYDNEDWLLTPELNLSGMNNVKLSFDHARGNAGAMNVGIAEGWYKVYATANYTGDVTTTTWIEIGGVNHTSQAWNYVSSGELEIPAAAKSAVTRIAFRYISRNMESATWEIKNMMVWAGTSSPPIGQTETFKITTWNSEWLGCTQNGPTDEDLQIYNIADAIRKMNPDIIAIQEVTQSSAFQSVNTLLSLLGDEWGGNIVPYSTSDCSQNQGIIYKKSRVQFVNSSLMSNGSFAQGGSYSYNWSNGRYPALYNVKLLSGNNAFPVSLINIHAKASSDDVSYTRRKGGAEGLKTILDGSAYNTKNVIIIGDFNDYLVGSQSLSTVSPYNNFITDANNYKGITKDITGYHYGTRIVDNMIISNELFGNYVSNSAHEETILPQSDYSFYYTTSDHIPVSASFNIPTSSTGIKNIIYTDTENLLKIYPNPAKDQIIIESGDLIIENEAIRILDISGRQVATAKLLNDKTMNVSTLSEGIYFVAVETTKGIVTQKFVKK